MSNFGSFGQVTEGLPGTAPNIFVASTADNLGTLTASGYLDDQSNRVKQNDVFYINYSDTSTFPLNVGQLGTLGEFYVNYSGGHWSLINALTALGTAAAKAASDNTKATVASVGSAVVAAHMALFVDTAGTIDDTAATAINNGAIQAGLSGTSGYLASFPTTALKGSLRLTAIDNTGDTLVTISNALHGQASVYSIPDSGVAASSFLLLDSAGTQTIATGSIALTAGYIRASAANALTAHAGGGQASALQLAKQINRVTIVATAGDSVKLPTSVAGMTVVVINADSTDAMDCFPISGEVINALSANTALSILANKTVIFYCAVAGTWNSVLTA